MLSSSLPSSFYLTKVKSLVELAQRSPLSALRPPEAIFQAGNLCTQWNLLPDAIGRDIRVLVGPVDNSDPEDPLVHDLVPFGLDVLSDNLQRVVDAVPGVVLLAELEEDGGVLVFLEGVQDGENARPGTWGALGRKVDGTGAIGAKVFEAENAGWPFAVEEGGWHGERFAFVFGSVYDRGVDAVQLECLAVDVGGVPSDAVLGSGRYGDLVPGGGLKVLLLEDRNTEGDDVRTDAWSTKSQGRRDGWIISIQQVEDLGIVICC